MNTFQRLHTLNSNYYFWSLDSDGFDIYLNCNNLERGTAYGLCLYDGVRTANGDAFEYEYIISEGLSFLKNFLKFHQKDLDKFFEVYTFEALNELIDIVYDFKAKVCLEYDENRKQINPFV